MRVYARQDETLDTICWRYFGRTQGIVEATLAINHGLCELPPQLPQGYPVDLPDLLPQPDVQTVQLWD